MQKQPQENCVIIVILDKNENSVNWAIHMSYAESFWLTHAGYLGKDNYIPSFTKTELWLLII